ncbi:ABC transporter permease [Paenibacillus sp. CF384]|uniref:ABC transporter permease n=1 Tax=Paenibacillus sp. CF384 TaxID=1884382 RepID=UPI000898D023|nr:ABC transporter permease [Paenibacillus sp. CF384]SDX74454.1 ABC-type transport system involved in multi-copper enzyme maturation, permease component [Paenibacillus sp. CF384]
MMWIAFAGKELFRKKIIWVSVVLTVLFIGLFCYGLSRTPVDPSQLQVAALMNGVMLLSLGLLFAQMIIAFLVLFTTMGAISGEVENGLMLAVLARPIPRWKVYLGKYAGIACWLIGYSVVLFFAILLPIHFWLDFPLYPLVILKSLLLFIWAPLLLLALTMFGSIYLPMLGNGVACAMLYGISLFSGFLENLPFASEKISQFALVFSMLLPSNMMLKRVTYELLNGLDLPVTTDMVNTMGPLSAINVPSMAFILYTVFYLLVLLVAGCFGFRRRDIA